MARTDSQLQLLKQALKQNCTLGQAINPALALNFLNQAQVEVDPEAYVPEIVLQHRKKKEQMAQQARMAQSTEKGQVDALFDMDSDIDNLSEVSERYAPPV